MFDIIYVTWFVHITTALVWSKFWYTYLAVSSMREQSLHTYQMATG